VTLRGPSRRACDHPVGVGLGWTTCHLPVLVSGLIWLFAGACGVNSTPGTDAGDAASTGGLAASGGASATGGAISSGGGAGPGTGGALGEGGGSGSGGSAPVESGGAMASGGNTGGAAGGARASGGSGAGGATRASGGTTGSSNTAAGDASVDTSDASGGARTGGAAGTATGGSAATGGAVGTGGVASDASATGGAATGGTTGTPAACASNEVSKCTNGAGPLGTEIKCDFGGGDGNYDVTVELGGDDAGDTYVDAEMYRRMLPELTTAAGQLQRFFFTANVRTPEGQPLQIGSTDSVPGLQVYFRGPAPRVSTICHQSAAKPVMLWIGGDSTVCDQDSTNYTGWGQRLPQFLQGPVDVANYADSGESSGSFLGSSAMFGAIKARWKSGDWFFIQMGHNDKTTTAATFQANVTSYVTAAKAAGVNLVLITPIARVGYALAEQHVNSTGANLPQIIRDLGKSENVPVIDLTVTTWNWIQTITPKDYFAADSTASGGYDHTHLGPKGGDAVAGFVRDAIKANPGIPALVPYLR
jgi:lysophospholipase L1-like esterase